MHTHTPTLPPNPLPLSHGSNAFLEMQRASTVIGIQAMDAIFAFPGANFDESGKGILENFPQPPGPPEAHRPPWFGVLRVL